MIRRALAHVRNHLRSIWSPSSSKAPPPELSAVETKDGSDPDHGDAIVRQRISDLIENNDLGPAVDDVRRVIDDGNAAILAPATERYLQAVVNSDDKVMAAQLCASIVSTIKRNDKAALDAASSTTASLVTFLSAKKSGALPALDSETADAIDDALTCLLDALRQTDYQANPGLWLTVMRCTAALGRFDSCFDEISAYVAKYPVSVWAGKVFGDIMDGYLQGKTDGYETDPVIWEAFPFAHNLNVALAGSDQRKEETRTATQMAETTLPRALRRQDRQLNILAVGADWQSATPTITSVEDQGGDQFRFRTFDFESLIMTNKTMDAGFHRFFDEANAAKIWADICSESYPFSKLAHWSDAIFLMRADACAAALAHAAPIGKAVMVCVLREDLQTTWPYFLNWARVDLVLFEDEQSEQILRSQNALFVQANPRTMIFAPRPDLGETDKQAAVFAEIANSLRGAIA